MRKIGSDIRRSDTVSLVVGQDFDDTLLLYAAFSVLELALVHEARPAYATQEYVVPKSTRTWQKMHERNALTCHLNARNALPITYRERKSSAASQ